MKLFRVSLIACLLFFVTQLFLLSCYATPIYLSELDVDWQADRTTIYKHAVELDIYLTPENPITRKQLARQLQRAQEKFKACKIRLDVGSTFIVKSENNWLGEWETLEFEDGEVTAWESAFFNLVSPFSAGLLFVNSLDWTIGDDGITAAAYPQFYADRGHVEGGKEAQKFYEEKMVGYSILGQAIKEWSVAHELGHAVLNLEHHDDPNNLMFSMGRKGHNPEFSNEQCESGRRNNPRIRAI